MAYNNRGLAYYNKGENDKAIADYTEAIRLDPKLAIAYNNRGLAYGNKGENDKAIADCTEAIRLDPKLALAYNNRGSVYYNKDENDKAIDDLTEAIRLDPKLAMAYNNRGLAFYNKGEDDKAIADCNEAICLAPKCVEAFVIRGLAYANKGDDDKAIADYTEVIRLNPKDAEAYHYRSIAYEKVGEHEKAQADITEAKRLGFSPRSPVAPTPASTPPLSSKRPLTPATKAAVEAAVEKQLRLIYQQGTEKRDSGEVVPQFQPEPQSSSHHKPWVMAGIVLWLLWRAIAANKSKASNAERWGYLIGIVLWCAVVVLWFALDIDNRLQNFTDSFARPQSTDLNQKNNPQPTQPAPQSQDAP